MEFFMGINWLAVLVASIVTMIVGWLWYSPSLFGKRWMECQKEKGCDVECKCGPLHYFGAFLVSFVMLTVLAALLNHLGAVHLTEAVKVALLVWLGFIATTQFSAVIWERRCISLYAVHVGCYLVNLIIGAVILTLWK